MVCTLPDHVICTIERVYANYNLARMSDELFNPNNYIWMLGVNTLKKLQACFDPHIIFEEKQPAADILMEIPVEVDTKNPDGLRLMREGM